MGAPSPDRMLVDAVLAGDSEAFRVLVERESRSVLRLCQRMLGDPQEAEDVAQEAFLRAYRGLPTFRGDGSFGAWVWRIALRLAAARLKRRPRLLTVDTTRDEGWLAVAAPAGDPAWLILDEERRHEVVRAISRLPPHQRRVVAMRFYSDLSLEEIAAATGTPIGTVKSRLHRAMASLREHLGSSR